MSDCAITFSNGQKMGYAEYGRSDENQRAYIDGVLRTLPSGTFKIATWWLFEIKRGQ